MAEDEEESAPAATGDEEPPPEWERRRGAATRGLLEAQGMKFAAGVHPAANRGPVFECGHARGVKARCDGLYELTACPVCAVGCPHETCGASPGQVCQTPAGFFSMIHRVRIAAAGVTRRRVADRKVSPEHARAVDLFHHAVDSWRAINNSTMRKTSVAP